MKPLSEISHAEKQNIARLLIDGVLSSAMISSGEYEIIYDGRKFFLFHWADYETPVSEEETISKLFDYFS